MILLKVTAASITGSVAIFTDAVHSSIALVAWVVALVSVRNAGEPADESHRYGHEKIENLARLDPPRAAGPRSPRRRLMTENAALKTG